MIQIDEPYFEWLKSQIEFPRTFKKTFEILIWRLHNKEFVWVVPGDDNRIQDARDLREKFEHEIDTSVFVGYFYKDYVSILEIIITLSKDLEFVASGLAPEWAWRLIDNLGLNNFYDPLTKPKLIQLDEILERLIWRTYDRDGRGGFFPLLDPKEDQTKVELWYQLNAYVNEIVQVEG